MQKLILNRRFWLLPIVGWTILVLTSLVWSLSEADKHSREIVHERARFIFEMVSSMRLWNARHGGIYALVDEQNPPNPHLEVEERDLTTPSGRKLTMVNPAYMTRQLSEIIKERSDLLIHITSLKPINPNNKANEWEAEALNQFELNWEMNEWSDFHGEGEQREYRFIAPLVTKKPCLKCHEKQGYVVGDIRGGISVTFPPGPLLATEKEHEVNYGVIHFMIWLLLTSLTLFGLSRHREQLLQLQGVMAHQEKLVEERTAQLQHEVFDREAAEERLQCFIEASAEGMLVFDTKMRCTLSNPAALKILGYEKESQLRGRSIHDFLCPNKGEPEQSDGNGCDECHIRLTLEHAKPFRNDDAHFLHADGHTIPVEMHSSPIVVDEHTLGTVVTFADITERKEKEALAWRLAHTDSLTGLINRHHFHSRLEQTLIESERYARCFALLFIDLDGFKAVNDQLGHDAGDELLRVCARRLLECLRESDTVARLGGDEFTIILPEIETEQEVSALTSRVIERVAEPYLIKGQQALISASIGIALYPKHGCDGDRLLNVADKAMYRAKEAGKNTYLIFDDGRCG